MSLTQGELERLQDAEENIKRLALLVKGGGSRNQLNRLLVLAQNEITQLTSRVSVLETKATTVLNLVRKLQ